MSKSGFDKPTATDFRHPTQAPGFGTAPDPFASIGTRGEDDDAIDFDDTYDGLGDQLVEDDDDFNDDTFGGEETTKPVGKDFDFFGSTSKVTGAINEEALRYNRQQPHSKSNVPPPHEPGFPAKPFKTGYEAYKSPAYIPGLQADAALWGTEPTQPAQGLGGQSQQAAFGVSGAENSASSRAPAKKMMSLEEVEAAMKAQPKKPSPAAAPQQTQPQPPSVLPQRQTQESQAPLLQQKQMQPQQNHLPYLQQRQAQHTVPQDYVERTKPQDRTSQYSNNHTSRPSQQLEQNIPTQARADSTDAQYTRLPQMTPRERDSSALPPNIHPSAQPRHILQNPSRSQMQRPSRPSDSHIPGGLQPQLPSTGHNGAHMPLPIIYHPSQIMNLTEEERNAYLEEEAKRAKRNHKIFLLSRGNGLMTPQDKNFITRIQLQQLMTATGNATEHDPDASLAEDFYYQVYNQIENRPRQNPQQPLSNFAQTYLFRTGNRQGGIGRRQRGGDGHVQRMELQVQRAVEAAKAKPKNKQLVIEGSLGKISFSNAKTPKPLLNLKRPESSDFTNRQNNSSRKVPQASLSTSDRKAILKNVEAVYSTLMDIEDHDRRLPPSPTEDSDPAAIQDIAEWQQTFQNLNQQLWMDLRVTEPIMPDSATLHPFIAFLSYPKGKKAVPRIFNHIDENQRLTILTMLMIHLDILDVIRQAQPQQNKTQPSSVIGEQVDLFLQVVMPSLLSYVSEARLDIIIGLLGLVISRVNLIAVACTRVGLEVLTMLLSRAAIVKATENPDEQTWEHWLNVYNRFFDLIEPLFGSIFPTPVSAGQDQYIWQFLAATGSGANPEQQQRLVLAVKDRVMETLQHSKTLPPEMASQRRGDVNLFMQAIGLDVDLLDG